MRRRPLAPLLDWMVRAPATSRSPSTTLAARAHMSPRTFARRFRAETGTTPYDWLTRQRVLLAQRLLESTDEPIERVAQLAGFGTAATLRHHFAPSAARPRRPSAAPSAPPAQLSAH